MFSWARNMIQLQLCAVVNQKYNPFNLGTLGFILPSLVFPFLGVSPHTYFWGLAFISCVIFLEFVVSVVRQSADILGIRVFSIAKANKEWSLLFINNFTINKCKHSGLSLFLHTNWVIPAQVSQSIQANLLFPSTTERFKHKNKTRILLR